jgi:hypothetical protein
MENITKTKFSQTKYSLEFYNGRTRFVVVQSGNTNDILTTKISEVHRIGENYFKEFKDKFKAVNEFNSEKWNLLIKNINLEFIKSIEINHFNSNKIFETYFLMSPNLSNWQNQYSFSDYYDCLINLSKLNENKDTLQISRRRKSAIFSVCFLSNIQNSSVLDLVCSYSKKMNELHQIIETELIVKNKKTILTKYFDFPKELKISCKQYLLYFAQFLKDLGINADSNLKEEAGKVLFSVIPTDDIEALDKIREALAVYLNLPSSPIVYDDSFAAMRLQQQIENLQHSQRTAVRELQFNEKLLTAQSQIINEKNVTISHQQSVIEQQNKIIEKISSKSIMIDSVENKEELVEICEGLKIGKSKFLMEQLGVHLNPATFAKEIGKKILRKQDETSILDLNQEKEENN